MHQIDYIRGQVDYMTIVCVIKAFKKNSKNTQKKSKSSYELEQPELCVNS